MLFVHPPSQPAHPASLKSLKLLASQIPVTQVLRALWSAGVPMRSQHIIPLLAAGLQVRILSTGRCATPLTPPPSSLQLPPVLVRAQFLKILGQ